MATAGISFSPVGPVPFEDVDGELPASERPAPEGIDDGDDHLADMVSSLPSKMEVNLPLKLRLYRGFWLAEIHVPAAVALRRRFVPRPDDVIVASLPKCGTTWLIALTFATMARHVHHPPTSAPASASSHPLHRLNPHQCLPFLEGLFAPVVKRPNSTHSPLRASSTRICHSLYYRAPRQPLPQLTPLATEEATKLSTSVGNPRT
ncbi:Os06g0252800 [Oryza sativa Japonica Group]|uniref:Sulfotransferase n=2 Tax=Oryza sativa subsp. japonica TaxID=39947 RepID=C7J3R0_ORYSJ|nr:flavonol 3-sulfotransferase-like [Oryza sativa Japonica Group]BAG91994.1 unnamed protein product [Oryza sativa Japonica Group]BAH93424.1 Os06g0252800 [Oryza sativa Japonica Group]BAS97070.1 Os06g0252800 [Oryza sativa Japonica Group]|eukprot:NP_001174696.1 Os06g0252800 [Oryza sativa Japonica Group]